MGLTEVLRHLPRLLRLRASLRRRFLAARPDVFVGIDAPEFNLAPRTRTSKRRHPHRAVREPPGVGLAAGAGAHHRRRLRPDPVPAAVRDRVLRRPRGARAIRRPSAGRCRSRSRSDRAAARRALGLPQDGVLVALLPGSRMSEVSRLAAPFVAAACHIHSREPGWGFLAPMASPATREAFEKEIAQLPGAPAIHVTDGQAQASLAAADAVIVASGTATLETLLTGRPMVVAYKTSALTAFLLRTVGLVKVRYFSQPNLLAGRGVVPEFFQDQVTGAALGDALLQELSDRTHVNELLGQFATIHRSLRLGGAARAAEAVLSVTTAAAGAHGSG